jgi:hypothetical protein
MMYSVMLFHDDDFKSCAKSQLFLAFSEALDYLHMKLRASGEYESALVYHTSNVILTFSRTGIEY